jgi:hypothetical protein
MLGHGVEFHSNASPDPATLLAFLEGYGWLHGSAPSVSIFMRKPNKRYSRSYLNRVRQQIEKVVRSGNLKGGRLAANLFAWFNG